MTPNHPSNQVNPTGPARPGDSSPDRPPAVRSLNKATQVCVGLEDAPGMFHRLCTCLSRYNVNVRALFVTEDEKCSWVYFIAEPIERALDAICEGGYNYFTEQVLALELEDKPGSLGQVAGLLAVAKINIEYVYGSGTANQTFCLVLKAEDLEGAHRALGIERP